MAHGGGGYSNSQTGAYGAGRGSGRGGGFGRRSQQTADPILLLRIGIVISALWSVFVGGRYLSLRKQLQDVTSHIPEANPWTADVSRNLHSFIESYIRRLEHVSQLLGIMKFVVTE